MPRKSKKSGGADDSSPAPSSSPGADDLPPEVLNGAAQGKSALERASERDGVAILNHIRNELGQKGGSATLRRRNPIYGRPQYQSLAVTMDSGDVTIDNLAQMFGGGDFEIRFRANDGSFERMATVSVDHSIKPKNPLETKEKPDAAAAAPAIDVAAVIRESNKANEGQLATVMTMMQAAQAQQTELFKSVLSRPEPKGETAAIIELVKDIREDARLQREEMRKSEERILKLIEKISDRGGTVAEPRSLREQLEEAKDLVDLMGGGGKSDDKTWIKDAAEVILPIVKEHFAGRAPVSRGPVSPTRSTASDAARPASPSPAQPAAAVPADAGAAQPTNDVHPMYNMALAHFQRQAINAAKRGQPTALELVESNLGMIDDPAMLHQIYNTANAPDWFERIFAKHGEATQHLKFLGQVREAVLEKAMLSWFIGSQKETPPLSAAQAVRDFIAWVHPDFREYLGNNIDETTWHEIFSPVIENEQLTAAFVAAARGEVEKQLEALEENGADNVVSITPDKVSKAKKTGEAK